MVIRLVFAAWLRQSAYTSPAAGQNFGFKNLRVLRAQRSAAPALEKSLARRPAFRCLRNLQQRAAHRSDLR